MDLKQRLREGSTPDAAPFVPSGGIAPEFAAADSKAADQPIQRAPNELERDWLQRIHGELMQLLDLSAIGELEKDEARKQVAGIIDRLLQKHSSPLNEASRQLVNQCIQDELFGLGPLEPLLADPSITDILVNGPQQIYVERKGKLHIVPHRFWDDAHLMKIIDRIVTPVGRRIDESSPLVDARLKDGSRVNVIIPPLAIDGPAVSIRKFPAERLRTQSLIDLGAITPQIALVLDAIVKGRLNVIISGGTGSGKTTFLNMMSGFIPRDERIVTIEDAAELQLQQPHVVRLETRPMNLEGKGEIKQRDLLKNALRMRPERIILGEIRAEEAFDMLQAMNTGHDGSLATIHANSPRDALTRLENMMAMTGMDLPTRMVHAQLASAIHVVIQLARMEDGSRKLMNLTEIQGIEGETIKMANIFMFERIGLDGAGRVVGQLKATGMIPSFYEQLQHRGIAPPKEVFNPER